MLKTNGSSVEASQSFPSEDEVHILYKRMKAGGTDGVAARDEMVVRNQGLVRSIANDYFRPGQGGLDFDDLFQNGVIGLMTAVERFDPALGNQFSTYATWWVKQAIRRHSMDEGRTVRIPVHVAEKISLLRRVALHTEKLLGRRPTLEEISEEVGLSIDRIAKLFEHGYTIGSMDDQIGNNPDADGSEMHNFVPDEHVLSPDLVSMKSDDCYHLLRWMAELVEHMTHILGSRDRSIICHRYGLLGFGVGKTLEEVGALYSVTRERIRQIPLKFFRGRANLGLPIHSHHEMVKSLRSIAEGVELLATTGREYPPEFQRILGGAFYELQDEDADEAGDREWDKGGGKKTRAKVKHKAVFQYGEFLKQLKELVGQVFDVLEIRSAFAFIATQDFNVPESVFVKNNGSSVDPIQDVKAVDPEKVTRVRALYTLALMNGDVRQVWKRQGKLFPSQVEEARVLREKKAAELERMEDAVKRCRTLADDVLSAMRVWCGIEKDGDEIKEKDSSVFSDIAGIIKQSVKTEVKRCWGVISGDSWTDQDYWDTREEVALLNIMLQ